MSNSHLPQPEGLPDFVPAIITDIAPDPVPTWRHKLRHFWNQAKGCVCAGVVSQGISHGFCIFFSAAAGAGSSGLTRFLSSTFNSTGGAIGLTTREIVQYSAPFILSPPISYAIDHLRNGKFTREKLAYTLGTCVVVAPLISWALPHDHNLEMARIWFESQTPQNQQMIREIATSKKLTVDEAALDQCGSNPVLRAEMERLQKPAYLRVLQHFKTTL